MAEGINGSGFSSREEAARYHSQRMMPRATNLNYEHAARTPDEVRREVLPPSPLDGQQFVQPVPQQEAPQQLIPQPFGPQQKKSLKQIAMERGQIPRKGQ